MGFCADAFGRPRDGAISPEKENRKQTNNWRGSLQSYSGWMRNWGFFIHKEGHPGPLYPIFFRPGGTSSGV